MNTHSSLPLPNPKNWVAGAIFKKNLSGKPKGGKQRKCKGHRKIGKGHRIFSFSFLAMMVTDTIY